MYTYGHRNPQGLVFVGDLLFEAEHGPSSDDEINLLVAGGNYGWPHVARAALRGQNRREDDHEGLSAPSRGRALRPHRPVSALPGNPGLLHRRIPLFHRRLAHRPAHEDHAEACRQACRRLLRLHRLLVLPVHRTAGRSDP